MSIINRETDYALRIIRSISHDKVKSVEQITTEENFAKPFAYKVIKKLEKSGFVSITKGPGGGVRLSCNLMDENLYSLMEALDNQPYINDCFKEGYTCENQDCSMCSTHKVLNELQSDFDKRLKEIKLYTMV